MPGVELEPRTFGNDEKQLVVGACSLSHSTIRTAHFALITISTVLPIFNLNVLRMSI